MRRSMLFILVGLSVPALLQAQERSTSDLSALDARVDSLVGRMNQNSGNKKVAAMAELLNALVAERKALRARIDSLSQGWRATQMMHRHMLGMVREHLLRLSHMMGMMGGVDMGFGRAEGMRGMCDGMGDSTTHHHGPGDHPFP